MAELISTPDQMVAGGKAVEYGWFDKPFKRINLLQAEVPGVPAFMRKYRLKQWQHYAIMGRDYLFVFVLFSAGYLGNSFCYFLDRKTGKVFEHHRLVPFGGIKTAQELWEDTCSYSTDSYKMEFSNKLFKGRHFASIDIAKKGLSPAFTAELEIIADLEQYQPMIVVLPVSEGRPMYTHKMACPVKGWMRIENRKIVLDDGCDIALVDVHKAYYPYRTKWLWATCAGYDDKGQLVGVNLVRNMIPDPDKYNENCLWVGNRISQFGAMDFDVDEKNFLSDWKITSKDGRVDLTFVPEGEREGQVNLGLLTSDYHQPYGLYNGRVVDDEGNEHLIKDYFGVAELHKAKF